MTALAKALFSAVGGEIETLQTLAIFSGTGLLASLFSAIKGLDLSAQCFFPAD
jgi:hypothetical protein